MLDVTAREPEPERSLKELEERDEIGPYADGTHGRSSPELEPPLEEPEPEADEPEAEAPRRSASDPKARVELALEERRDTLVQQAARLQVINPATYERAADYAKTFAGWIKEAEAHFDPDIEAAHRLHKSLCDKRSAFVAPLKAALDAMKERAGTWYRAAESARLAEQRRLEEGAAREAAAERARIIEESKKAAAAGNVQEAATLIAESKTIEAAPVTVARTAPAVRGIAQKEAWTYEMKDFETFVCAVARPVVLRELAADLKAKGAPVEVLAYLESLAASAPAIPFTAVEENGAYLRTRARADRNTLQWPGVKFFDKGSMAVRAS